MKMQDFIKQLSEIFLPREFTYMNSHSYKKVADDTVIVFGVQKSLYGKYCYIEYGYAFPSINRHMPYSKFTQLNSNCGRVMTAVGQAIQLDRVNADSMRDIKKEIFEQIDRMVMLTDSGKKS